MPRRLFSVKTSLRNLLITAVLMAVGFVLPFLTGQIPSIGNMLSPLHLPVFICGLCCGWQRGAILGAVLPLARQPGVRHAAPVSHRHGPWPLKWRPTARWPACFMACC